LPHDVRGQICSGCCHDQLPALAHRFIIFSRMVKPHFEWRCSRWPYASSQAVRLQRLHRRMVAIIIRPKRLDDDTFDRFARRRGREVSKHIGAEHDWANAWAKRVHTWKQHLYRADVNTHWPAALLKWRGKLWMQDRRVAQGSARATAGRTATRAQRGGIATRWHDGMDLASSIHLGC